jgi:hypothetical protein
LPIGRQFPEVIQAQSAHGVGDALGRACNLTQFLE